MKKISGRRAAGDQPTLVLQPANVGRAALAGAPARCAGEPLRAGQRNALGGSSPSKAAAPSLCAPLNGGHGGQPASGRKKSGRITKPSVQETARPCIPRNRSAAPRATAQAWRRPWARSACDSSHLPCSNQAAATRCSPCGLDRRTSTPAQYRVLEPCRREHRTSATSAPTRARRGSERSVRQRVWSCRSPFRTAPQRGRCGSHDQSSDSASDASTGTGWKAG